jgi:hypothetical protein
LNQLVDFHEIQQGGHATEGDLDAINFNPIPFNHFKMVKVTGSVTDWYRTKHPMHCSHFLTSVLGLQQRYLTAKQEDGKKCD